MGAPTGTSDLDQGKYDTDPGTSFSESEKAQQRKESNTESDGGQTTASEESPESQEATTSSQPEQGEDPDEGRQSSPGDESNEEAASDQQDPTSEGSDDQTESEATTSGEDQDRDGDGTPEEGETEPEGQEEIEKPFHYNGLNEEQAENFDGDPDEYVFISGADGGETAYKDVPSMVEGFENLQQHRQRLEQENSNYKSQLSEMKAKKEKEVEELRARARIYEDAYGDEIPEVLADRYMPDKYEGMTEEDFEDEDARIEYKVARERAREKAEEEFESIQEEAEQAGEKAKEQQQQLEEAKEEAISWVEDIREDPEDRFDLPEDDIGVLLPEVFNEMKEVVETEEGEQEITPLYRAQRLKALGHDAEAEMIIDLIGEKMRRLKGQKREKIKNNTNTQRRYRTPDPEPAEEPAQESTREVGNPRKSFSESQRG